MSLNKFYFSLFLALIAVFTASSSQALEFPNPLNRLKNTYFSGTYASGLTEYLNLKPEKCFSELQKINLTPYSNEPEKFYLLRALCSPKLSQPAAAIENIGLALKEKGSSSDILYVAALILAEVGANEDALKRFQEAIWFNSFKKMQEHDFYLDLGTFQYKVMLYGEAGVNLAKALELGNKSIDAKFMLADIAVKTNNRRNAILLARQLKNVRNDTLSKETLLLALMVSADPLFHKREVAEAASIAAGLGDSSIIKADVGVAATKALLITHGIDAASPKLQKSFAANPEDPRLQALDEQIRNEKALLLPPSD